MTVYTILHFLWAFGWSAILLTAFFGWGQLVMRLLCWQPPSIAISACVGTAAAVFVGGLLNLLRLITFPALLGFTLAGVALAVWFTVTRSRSEPSLETSAVKKAWRESWPWKRMTLACFILFFVFRAASTPMGRFLETDDENFYLAMPVKMMQTHHFAADPFSERRIESSLGGSYFLQCLQLCCLPLKNVQMPDQFAGFVLLVLLTLALAEQFGLSPPLTAVLGILCVVQVSELNLTFTVLPSALWLAMILIAAREPSPARRPAVSALLVGLLAGTMCALKSTYLPYAALFCAALYPLLGRGAGWKGALILGSAAFIGALIVMLPWMIAMRMTSATFLYPILGSGYDYSAYHQSSTPFTANIDPRNFPWREIRFASLMAAQLFLLRKKGAGVFLAASVICLVASIATRFATGGDDTPRYIWPIMLPTFLVISIHFASEMRQRPSWRPGPILWVSITVLLFVNAIHGLIDRQNFISMWRDVGYGLADKPMDTAETRQEYANIAAALPREGLVLTTLQDPYLLDFSDNRIFLADFPGCAGPPPGWPIRADGEALAKYLLGHSIRYLAYSYAGNAQLDYCRRVSVDLKHMSIRSQVQYGNYLLANEQYLALRRTRQTLYDDGSTFIVDLATKVASGP